MKKNILKLALLLLLITSCSKATPGVALISQPVPIPEATPTQAVLPPESTPTQVLATIPSGSDPETDEYIELQTYPTFGIEIGINKYDVLPQASQAHTTWIRCNALLWSDVQPNNSGEFLWEEVKEFEDFLVEASRSGMQVVLIIRSTPKWAQKYTGVFCGPVAEDNFEDFAAFMQAIVERYSVPPFNVSYFEIGNEPDVDRSIVNPTSVFGCWGDKNDAYYGGGYYADMLKTVYPAMKAANPETQLVLGGLLLDCDPRLPVGEACASDWQKTLSMFFEGILRNGGGDYFDVVSFHGYNYYNPDVYPILMEKTIKNWREAGGNVEGKLGFLKSLMSQYQLNKPLMLTEVALLNSGDATPESEAMKADYLVWLYTRNWAKGLIATIWYPLDGPGWRNSSLLDGQQNPLPAYDAYQFMTSTLSDAVFKSELAFPDGAIGFEFMKDNKIWVLFSEDGSQITLTLPDGFDKVYDLFGEGLITGEGKISFSRPIYIVFQN